MMATDMESESWYQDLLQQQQQQDEEDQGSTCENFRNEETATSFVERRRNQAKKHRRSKKTHRSPAKRRTDALLVEAVAPKRGGSGEEPPPADDLRDKTGSLQCRTSQVLVTGEQPRVAGVDVGNRRHKKSNNNKKKKETSHRRTNKDYHLVASTGSHKSFPEESSWCPEGSATTSDPPGMVLSSTLRQQVSTHEYVKEAATTVGADVEGSNSISMFSGSSSLGGRSQKRSKTFTSKNRSGSRTSEKRSPLGRREKSHKGPIQRNSRRGGIPLEYYSYSESAATYSTLISTTLDDSPRRTETEEPCLRIGAFRVGGDDMETQDSPLVDNELPPPRDYFEDEYALEAYRVEEEQPLQTVEAKPFRDRRVLSLIATFGVLCLVIGLTVFLTAGNETPEEPASSQESDPRGTLQARLISDHLEDEHALTEAHRFYNAVNDETISTGFDFAFFCKVLPCLEGGDNACKVALNLEVYEPGCCIGENCTEEEKCIESCPAQACRITAPSCTNPSCIECDKAEDGTDLYVALLSSSDIDCLDTGYAITDSGQVYKWAIACGPVSSTGQDELNRGFGEYSCPAFRQGESIRAPVSSNLPCQYIQLAECGCAPDDVFDFGLGRPEKPCKTKEDCAFLCSDAGEEHAKQLCYSFGGIEWWEGANVFNETLFWSPYEGFFNNTVIEIFDEEPPS